MRLRRSETARRQGRGGALEELFMERSLPLIIGSGGVLSFAPDPEDVCVMLADALSPYRPCEFAVDNRFLLPQVGLLSTVDTGSAMDLLNRHSLRRLAACLPCQGRPGSSLNVAVKNEAGQQIGEWRMNPGERKFICRGEPGKLTVSLRPTGGADCGFGANRAHSMVVRAGELGVFISFQPVTGEEAAL